MFRLRNFKPPIRLGLRFNTTKPAPKPSLRSQLTPFIKFARPEFKLVGGSLVLLLISSGVTMSVPFSMGAIIDIVMHQLGDKNLEELEAETPENQTVVKRLLLKTGSLTNLFGVLAGVFVVGACANAGRQILMSIASGRVITRLRNTLFEKLLQKDIAFHDANRSGELISRLSTDTTVVGGTLTNNIADGTRSLVMALTGLSAMLYVNVDLTLTTMLIVPFVSGVAVFYGRFVRSLAKKTTDASAELTKFAEEKISNVKTVRSFSQEPKEIEIYNQKSDVVYDLGIKEGVASSVFFSTMGFSGNIVILAILYYGGSLVQLGQISIGELTSFFLYTIYVGTSLIGLSNWFTTLNKGAGAGERLFKLLEETPVIESTVGQKPNLRGNIEFKGISFAYPTRPDSQILKDLTFSLKEGETVAVVGHSGSGKSTIAQLMMRFYDPSAGEIYIDGISIKELNPHWMRENLIGLVSQEPILFGTSIMENIRYGKPSASDEEVIEASKQANAHDFIMGFPEGYKTNVGDRGRAVSGGQKQRIAIARALLKNPTILVLDEATSALDTSSEILVQEALDRLIKGRTVITIAHRLSTIQKADRICMLSKGKIIESGTFDELIAKKGAFAALVGETDE